MNTKEKFFLEKIIRKSDENGVILKMSITYYLNTYNPQRTYIGKQYHLYESLQITAKKGHKYEKKTTINYFKKSELLKGLMDLWKETK